MQRLSLRLSALLIILIGSVLTAQAQDDTTKPTSIDPKLLEWENARIPREYTIAEVGITGIKHLDTAIVLSISGLQAGASAFLLKDVGPVSVHPDMLVECLLFEPLRFRCVPDMRNG